MRDSVPSMNLPHPLDGVETTNRSLHRAQTESFAFRLYDGDVLVQNLTYLRHCPVFRVCSTGRWFQVARPTTTT